MVFEGEAHTPQNSRKCYSEPENSCETEDSCDYSSGSEHNYLMGSRQLLKKRSELLPPETDDPVSEKEGQDEEVANVQRGQTRSLYKFDCLQKCRLLIEGKAGSKHIQHKTNRQQIAKKDEIIILDSDTEYDNEQKYKKSNRKRMFSSVDSGDAPCVQNRPNETEYHHCGTEKSRLSSKDSPKKQPQYADKETQTHSLGHNPVIPHFLVLEYSPPNHILKLLKESRIHMQGKYETCVPKIPTASREKTDSCEKNTEPLYRYKEKCVSKTKPANDATKYKVQANIAKPRLMSRQLALPSQQGASTSISSSSSTCGQLSEARQSSASSRGLSQSRETSATSSLRKFKLSTSIPRHYLSSSKLQRSHSYSNPSTLDHPYTPRTVQSAATKQVTTDWKKSFYPTRRDRKSSLPLVQGTWRKGTYCSFAYASYILMIHSQLKISKDFWILTYNCNPFFRILWYCPL